LTSTLERTNKEDEQTLVEQEDGGGYALTTYVPLTKETIAIKDNHVVGMVQMFESSNDLNFHVNLDMQIQLHTHAQKLGSVSKMIVSTSISKGGTTNSQHIVALGR
jgi:hypothetical protein